MWLGRVTGASLLRPGWGNRAISIQSTHLAAVWDERSNSFCMMLSLNCSECCGMVRLALLTLLCTSVALDLMLSQAAPP